MFALLFWVFYCFFIIIGIVFVANLWVRIYIPYLDRQKELNRFTFNRLNGTIYKFCFISFLMIIFGFLSPMIFVIEKYKYKY